MQRIWVGSIRGNGMSDGNVLQCLGGIDAAFDKHARRVFEAELASEAMACLPAATFGIGKAA
jgi:hypothetical protein